MNWRDHIHSDKNILGGKPVIKGTRISVEFLLELIGGGWSQDRIVAEYPHLKVEDIRAAALFAQDLLVDERYVAIEHAGGR